MNSLNYLLVTCLLFLISFVGPKASYSQNRAPSETTVVTDSVKYAFLPALAYNSDLGLIGGGIMSRYHYREGKSPFHSYFITNAVVSTKGLLSFQFLHDKPELFDSELRSTSEVYVARFLEDQYYGIGTYTEIDPEPKENPDYHYYKSFYAGFELTLRNPVLYNAGSGAQLDVFGFASFIYLTPWDNGPDRLISQEQPEGIGGSHTAELGGGIIMENRNSEFNPTIGSYAKASLIAGQKIWGSSYNYLKAEAEGRSYLSFYLIREITFANKILFTHTSGNLPFWKLPELGGSNTLRGYPEKRFLDDNALLLNTELRTWLFEFPEYDIRLGGSLFMDIGRSFPNGMSMVSVLEDLRYTYGFGSAYSFFTNDFIMRADVGFSEEGYGIYFTAGFLF